MKELDKKILELKRVPGLYNFTLENCFIAGGAVRDTIRGVKPKDYDLFFRDEESKDEFIQKFGNSMKITGIGNYNYKDFQFITLYTGSPRAVINRFDWNVNQYFYEFGNVERRMGRFCPKELKLNTNCEKPLSAYLRLPDMLSKGFTITKEELMFTLSYINNRVNFDNLDNEFEWVSDNGGAIGSKAAKNAIERAKKDAKHPRHSKLVKALK